MPDDLTPNGCRFDNGRCFTDIVFDEAYSSAVVTFSDGSRYRVGGMSRQDTATWAAMLDPGCFYNKGGFPYRLYRLNGPTV